MDGVELCDQLRGTHADALGVLVTAFAAYAAVRAASPAGNRPVLSRPVEFGPLLQLVDEVADLPGHTAGCFPFPLGEKESCPPSTR
jgi:hypothetical protein